MTMERLLAQNLAAVGKLTQVVDSLRLGQGEQAQLRRGITTPFDVQKFDLTTAHTGLEVTVLPCAYIQAISDGELYGVTVSLVRQGAPALDMSQVTSIPAGNVNKLYLTNDVRAGRNTLWLYFHRIEPFGTRYTGDPVTNAELAARLGRINTFDRRGEVVWFDDFEDNLAKWVVSASGLGASVALSTASAKNGAQSCKITSGNVIGDYSQIIKYTPYPKLTRIGFEIAFTCNGSMSTYNFSIILYDGTNYYECSLRYLPPTTDLQAYNDGAWVSLSTAIKIYNSSSLFNIIKIVGDFSTKKLTRVMLNHHQFDLTPYAMFTSDSAVGACLQFTVNALTAVNSNQPCYVDDAIITQNEP